MVLAVAAVIALAGLAAYANTFPVPLLFDDLPSIVYNPTLADPWEALLRPPGGYGITVSGRPLLNFSLAVNYALSGTDVWSYHALNLLIHILASLTLFGIVRRTLATPVGAQAYCAHLQGRDKIAPLPADLFALVIALLWTLHPLQTEAVTYIIQRTESLMGLFYLLTLYCFIRGAECQNHVWGPSTGSGPRARRGAAPTSKGATRSRPYLQICSPSSSPCSGPSTPCKRRRSLISSSGPSRSWVCSTC